jgi:single-strand DNA-binding protein
MINSVTLVGNLTQDTESKVFQNGSSIAKNTIAVNRKYQLNGEWVSEPTFISLTFNGYLVDKAKALSKGDKVAINGYLKQENWLDSNGVKHSKYVIVVSSLETLIANSTSKEQDVNNSSKVWDNNTSTKEEECPF